MKPPDWGYTRFGLAVVGFGVVILGASKMSSEFHGYALISLGVLLMLFSLRPSVTPRDSEVSAAVSVYKAVFTSEARLDGGRVIKDPLSLPLLVEVKNDSARDVTVRPTALALISPILGRWGRGVPVIFHPVPAISPVGTVADYRHFPEGQYTAKAGTEGSFYFFFAATSPKGQSEFRRSGRKLRLSICLPKPRKMMVPFPPIAPQRLKERLDSRA
jgi:hypothetical protein